jgi:transposase InsO family protein
LDGKLEEVRQRTAHLVAHSAGSDEDDGRYEKLDLEEETEAKRQRVADNYHRVGLNDVLQVVRVSGDFQWKIPPRSEMNIPVEMWRRGTQNRLKGTYIIEPHHGPNIHSFRKGREWVLASCIVSQQDWQGAIVVRVMNPTMQAQTVYPGQALGRLDELDMEINSLPSISRLKPRGYVTPGSEATSNVVAAVQTKDDEGSGSDDEVANVPTLDDTHASKEELELRIEETCEHLTPEQREELTGLLNEYQFMFRAKPGRTDLVRHSVDTGDSRPIRGAPFRLSPAERTKIREDVADMLEGGVIQPSRSAWGASVVLAKKKDGTLRFCVDYRKLNAATVRDVYPLPRIDDTLDKLGGARYFSALDLTSGYWQVEMEQEDKAKTAFITPDGLYEFNVMPFGLCNAPATFQRLMDSVLAPLGFEYVLVYLDDVMVFSRSFEDHLRHLRAVLTCVRDANLSVKLKKCNFAQLETVYLGHMISAEGVRPEAKKVEAIEALVPPTTVKGVRSFLGFLGFYRRFVKDFSRIAKPLTELTKKNQAWEWTPECEEAFKKLKQALMSEPVLANPDFTRQFVIRTDASFIGLGATLSQEYEGKLRPVAYASRILKPAETRYTATEVECLGMKWAINYFRPYVYGNHFTLQTDHVALTWLKTVQHTNARLIRTALALQGLDMEVIHKPGLSMHDADALSRLPRKPKVTVAAMWEDEVRTKGDEDVGNQQQQPTTASVNTVGWDHVRTRRRRDYWVSSSSDEDRHSGLTSESERSSEEAWYHPGQGIGEEKDETGVLIEEKAQGWDATPGMAALPTEGIVFGADGQVIRQPALGRPPGQSRVRWQVPEVINDGQEESKAETDTKTGGGDRPNDNGVYAITGAVETTVGDGSDGTSSSDDDMETGQSPNQVDLGEVQQQTGGVMGVNMMPKGPLGQESECDLTDAEQRIHTKVQEYLRTDSYYSNLVKYITGEEIPEEAKTKRMEREAGQFIVRNGLLYRTDQLYLGKRAVSGRLLYRLVVPPALRQEVLFACHDHLLSGGHLGREKTFERIRARYYWRSLYSDVAKWCRSCRPCATRNTPLHLDTTQRPLPIPNEPFELVSVDVVGPFVAAKVSGNRYAIVFCDHLTRWVECIPFRTNDTTSCARVLVERVLCRHGAPKCLLSDRGGPFISEVARVVYEILSVRKLDTAAYRPQTNGLVERFNRTFAAMLSKFVNSKHTDWDRFVPYVTFSYNTTTHKAMGVSPFRMLYGREARLPVDAMLQPGGGDESVDTGTYVTELERGLRTVHNLGQESLQREQQQREQKHGSIPKQTFLPGDSVLVKKPNLEVGVSKKLLHSWRGPFIVRAKLGTSTYTVSDAGGGDRVVHASRMKKFYGADHVEPDEADYASFLEDAGEPDPGEGNRTYEPITVTSSERQQPANVSSIAPRVQTQTRDVVDPTLDHDGMVQLCRVCHVPRRGHQCPRSYQPTRQTTVDRRRMGIAAADSLPKFGIINPETQLAWAVYDQNDRRQIQSHNVTSWVSQCAVQGRTDDDIWAEECNVCTGKGKVMACYGCNLVFHGRCLVEKTLPRRSLRVEEELLCPQCTLDALGMDEDANAETELETKS